MKLSNKRITKGLIRLPRCAGWSAHVLFTNPEDRFSRVEAHIIIFYICTRSNTVQNFLKLFCTFLSAYIHSVNEEHPSIINIKENANVSNFKFSPVTQSQVKNCIKLLDPKKQLVLAQFHQRQSKQLPQLSANMHIKKCRWRSKMPHPNFKGGFWIIKIRMKLSVLLPILCQKTL